MTYWKQLEDLRSMSLSRNRLKIIIIESINESDQNQKVSEP